MRCLLLPRVLRLARDRWLRRRLVDLILLEGRIVRLRLRMMATWCQLDGNFAARSCL